MWKLILLGIVQGISEFLPISSDGHLLLCEHFLGIGAEQLSLVIWLHLGTLAATCLAFRRELLDILRGDWRTAWLIALAMVPAAIVGLTCRDVLEERLYNMRALGFFFWGTAAALFIGEAVFRTRSVVREQVNVFEAVAIGIAQAVAILPGVSRSGMTISAGLACGLRRSIAARFSFLLSVPTIAGAVLVEGFHTIRSESTLEWGPIAVGVLVSFVVGFVSLQGLLMLVRRYPMYVFGVYCTLLGTGVIAYEFFGVGR